MRSRYKITAENGIYFMTSTIVEWLPVFTNKPYFELIIQSFNYCRNHKGLQLYGYVILENHLHLVAAGSNLGKIITDFKKFTARTIIDQLELDRKAWLLNQLAYYKKRYKIKSDYQVWQEGYHPELILTPEMLNQKLEYIHLNPVKRGYVCQAEHWLYSSARNYILGDSSIIALDALPV
jgi:REP element-mobilizing transposase RayT